MTSFSRRHDFEPPEPETTVHLDAPPILRNRVVECAYAADLQPSEVRRITCEVLCEIPDPQNWSEYPNINYEVRGHLDSCAWYHVYDIIEAICDRLLVAPPLHDKRKLDDFQDKINTVFRRKGIGWKLVDGKVTYRGEEPFETVVGAAPEQLEQTGLPTAAMELREAVRDLSRQPDPDLSRALHHAMAAVECVMGRVCGDDGQTLGKLLRHKPYKGTIPPPLDIAVAKLCARYQSVCN